VTESSSNAQAPPVSQRRILETWWPLAASWMLMGLELPMLSAVVARLDEPAANLAAMGAIVVPLALLVESPIIMLLAASTALSRDWVSYRKLQRFAHGAGFVLTLVHVAVAFTPLYDVVVADLLRAPIETHEPGRLGLQILTPWTWSIAARRFNQGILIRFGRSRAVGLGTAVRLVSNALVLLVGYLLRWSPGTLVAAIGLSVGVLTESAYIALKVRSLRPALGRAETVHPALTLAAFLRFYTPLAMTSLLHLLMEPVGAAALGRMPRALDSLAVWPVVYGLTFVAQSLGIAYNEVVVALVGEPGGRAGLRRFARVLTFLGASPLALMALVPALSALWFGTVTGLPQELALLAHQGLVFALPLPCLVVWHSWFQGILVHSGRTRGIPESVGLFLATASSVAFAGVAWGRTTGLFVALTAVVVGGVVQALWLRRCVRKVDCIPLSPLGRGRG